MGNFDDSDTMLYFCRAISLPTWRCMKTESSQQPQRQQERTETRLDEQNRILNLI